MTTEPQPLAVRDDRPQAQTPGPWFVSEIQPYIVCESTDGHGFIASTGWSRDNESSGYANACLIAEAPAMLSLLEDFSRLSFPEHDGELVAKAKTLVLKMKGETA